MSRSVFYWGKIQPDRDWEILEYYYPDDQWFDILFKEPLSAAPAVIGPQINPPESDNASDS